MQDAMRDLMPLYGVPIGPPVDPATLFDPQLPTVLEIGCGMGAATLVMARSEPERGVLAVDVHTRGIAALLLVPYVAWVSFATVLTAAIWRLN